MKRLTVVFFLCFSFSSLYSQNAVTLKNEGNKAMTEKQYARALVLYERALGVWGNKPMDNAMIFSMGACAYLKTSDKAFKEQNDKARSGFNEALKYLNMSLELAPNDENAKKAKNNCQNQMKMLI